MPSDDSGDIERELSRSDMYAFIEFPNDVDILTDRGRYSGRFDKTLLFNVIYGCAKREVAVILLGMAYDEGDESKYIIETAKMAGFRTIIIQRACSVEVNIVDVIHQ